MDFITILKKDFTLEWRNKYSLIGFLLYITSIITICNLSLNVDQTAFNAIIWNTLFWIILLFTSINAIAKSFLQESQNRYLYYYTILDPKKVIIAKIVYNAIIMIGLSFIALGLYSLFLGYPIKNSILFNSTLFLGSIAFSAALSMISAIASKTGNPILMAILSFPIVIPILIIIISLTNQSLFGVNIMEVYDKLLALIGVIIIVICTSYILFPYLWREN